MQVLIRNRRRDDALGGFQRVEHRLTIAKRVQRRAFAEVPHSSVMFDDGRDFRHRHVGSIPRLERAKFLGLSLILDDVGDAGFAAAVARHQLVVRHRSDVAVSVPLPANGVANERVQKVRETKNLHPIARESRGVQSVLRRVAAIERRRRRRVRRPGMRSEERGARDVQVTYTAVHGAQRGFPLLVSVPREVRAEDEEKREDDGYAEMSVEVERDVALLVRLDVVAAVRDLDDVGEEADDGGEHNLRHHLEHDGILELEYLGEEREAAVGEFLDLSREDHLARSAETAVDGDASGSGLPTRATGVRGGVAETGSAALGAADVRVAVTAARRDAAHAASRGETVDAQEAVEA